MTIWASEGQQTVGRITSPSPDCRSTAFSAKWIAVVPRPTKKQYSRPRYRQIASLTCSVFISCRLQLRFRPPARDVFQPDRTIFKSIRLEPLKQVGNVFAYSFKREGIQWVRAALKRDFIRMKNQGQERLALGCRK